MKILQIIQRPQLRGAEVFACQLSRELQSHNVLIDVVYLFGEPPATWPFNLNFIALDGIQKKRFWDLKAYKKLSRIIEDGNYDLVQANASDTLKYAALSKAIYRWSVPLVYRNASKMSHFVRNAFHGFVNKFFLSKCDYFVSVSENCRKDLVNIYPTAAERSCTITIGTYRFDEIVPKMRDHNEPLIINIGSHEPVKNQTVLIDIFTAFYEKHKVGYLWLLGDGKLREDLEQKVRSRGLDKRVIFWGSRADVISFLRSADLMVMPSLIEGIPAVILEAMSCGVPVIASNVGGISEVIQDNFNGYCIDPSDTAEFLVKIERLFSTESLRTTIVYNAKRVIEQRFLMPKIAEEFAKLYEDLIRRRQPAAPCE